MCESCLAKTSLWEPQVLNGWYLIRTTQDGSWMKAGEFGLVVKNDPTFVFSEFPTPDPYENLTDEKIDKLDKPKHEAFDQWTEAVGRFAAQISREANFNDVHDLIEACEQSGYDRRADGDLYFWLFNCLARFLAAHPEPTYSGSRHG